MAKNMIVDQSKCDASRNRPRATRVGAVRVASTEPSISSTMRQTGVHFRWLVRHGVSAENEYCCIERDPAWSPWVWVPKTPSGLVRPLAGIHGSVRSRYHSGAPVWARDH